MADIKVNLHYPASNLYNYITRLERLNLDDERKRDISNGNGYVIRSSKPIKDDVKDPDGIFSPRYGRNLDDLHPFSDRYKCRCGKEHSAFNNGKMCSFCHTRVQYVGDNFSYFGYIVFKDPYYIIHPALYMSLLSFIGADEFNNIIFYQEGKDEDGNEVEIKRPKKEPFFGIGMIAFHDRFDEIMDYYKETKCKTAAKQERYEDIMRDRDKIFTQSFPVFTTLLRPFKIEAGEMHYEETNSIFKLMASLAEKINKDSLMIDQYGKTKNILLYDFQMKVKELFDEINKILSGKKGSCRALFGGRLDRLFTVSLHRLHSEQLLCINSVNCWDANLERVS